ncbi:hypothetical protein JT06_10155 [Desulfobulbus sp. Tol-SR]|jgi:hypothetical protein|nr:hypothetical protein JT06_10155 [Desulfobulbus sp. Tol-SR]
MLFFALASTIALRLAGPCTVVALLLVVAPSAAAAPSHPAYLYQETTGRTVKNFLWSRTSSAGEEVITVNEGDAVFINRCDGAGRTRAWSFREGEQTIVHATRTGNQLKISGTRQGKAIATTVTVDDRPWFQPLSFSLGAFLASARTKVSFWMIRSDKLEVVAMQAKKGEVEEIAVAGRKVRAQKVVIRRQGMLAALWQAAFWFREDDRIFVRYQGVHGPPGTDETVVQLSQEVLKTSTSPGQAAVGLTGDP